MTMPATTAPVTVAPGQTVQVPISQGGGSVINNGQVPVTLAPTNPAIGTPTVLLPNGAVPWPTSPCYATSAIGASANALLSFIPGVTIYASGDLTAGGVGLGGTISGVTTTVTGFVNPDSVAQFEIPDLYTVHSWGIALSIVFPYTLPTSGMAQLGCVSGGGNDVVVDHIGVYEPFSDRLKGLSFNAGATGDVIPPFVSNQFNVAAQFVINYYNAGGPFVGQTTNGTEQ